MAQTKTTSTDEVKIKVFRKTVKADGKTFDVFETTDKNKNRLKVSFTQGCEQGAPDKSCTIILRNFNTDYWVDNRKRFPVLRIKCYELCSDTPTTGGENPLI